MNIFQKQLLLKGRSLSELPDLSGRRCDYGPLATPQRVTAEEFERTMAEIHQKKRRKPL
jgi:hypothetical protein